MPSKKKSKGKARKSKASKQERVSRQHEQQPASLLALDDVGDGEVADSSDSVLSFEDMMSRMRGQIVSSLGDGYDAHSLRMLDQKLCDYFLPEDDFYYDDDKNTKSANPEKPSDSEIEHYKKSDVIRKGVSRKAGGIKATTNFLGGQGHLNLEAYQEFYDDILTYHYGWFEIIFKGDRTELLTACNTIVKFASVKLESVGNVDDVQKIIELLREIKDLFQLSVKSHDKEACEDAGMLEYDCYEVWYKMSIEMTKAKMKDEADQYFDEASTAENTWGYWEEENRHCAKVLEFAIGRPLSREDLSEIDIHAMENGGFYYKCLQAYLRGHRGSVCWNPSGNCYDDLYNQDDDDEEEECCNNCGVSSGLWKLETGKKLLRCTRCKCVFYCSKECQIADWKSGHKNECSRT